MRSEGPTVDLDPVLATKILDEEKIILDCDLAVLTGKVVDRNNEIVRRRAANRYDLSYDLVGVTPVVSVSDD